MHKAGYLRSTTDEYYKNDLKVSETNLGLRLLAAILNSNKQTKERERVNAGLRYLIISVEIDLRNI